jgi:hypothetical protein
MHAAGPAGNPKDSVQQEPQRHPQHCLKPLPPAQQEVTQPCTLG